MEAAEKIQKAIEVLPKILRLLSLPKKQSVDEIKVGKPFLFVPPYHHKSTIGDRKPLAILSVLAARTSILTMKQVTVFFTSMCLVVIGETN